MLKEHNLTSMQWFVLGTIYDSGDDGIQLSLLAAKLQTGLPFITNMIKLLESKNIVERRSSPKDSRAKCVSIVPAYRSQCQAIEKDLRARLRKTIYRNVSAEDLKIYIKVLYQLGKLD